MTPISLVLEDYNLVPLRDQEEVRVRVSNERPYLKEVVVRLPGQRRPTRILGFVYDEARDAFIPPQPFTSFVLNEDKCEWSPPTTKPELSEGQTGMYVWNEEAYQEDNSQGWEYIDYP